MATLPSGKGTRSAYKSIDDSMMAFRLMAAPMAAFSMPEDIPEDDD